jgi:hypothetical protein
MAPLRSVALAKLINIPFTVASPMQPMNGLSVATELGTVVTSPGRPPK